MSMMQQVHLLDHMRVNDLLTAKQLLGENLRAADRMHNGLCSNLYDVQLKSRELLPDFNLRSGEVVRVGQFPISGTSAMV